MRVFANSLLWWYTIHGGDQTYKIFGFRDLTIFPKDFLSDGDSVYTRENLHENLGTPVKTCWICTGTPVNWTPEILVVVIIVSLISSVCGVRIFVKVYGSEYRISWYLLLKCIMYIYMHIVRVLECVPFYLCARMFVCARECMCVHNMTSWCCVWAGHQTH